MPVVRDVRIPAPPGRAHPRHHQALRLRTGARLHLDASAAQLIERYAERWPTEVAYEEGKELAGVGQARNRAEKAVQRTVPFQFLAMSLTIIWYALSGHHPDDVKERRERHPWYLTKTTPSFADMLAKLRRVIIASQFHPERGCAPTPREITSVQQAWASAGL